MSASLKKVGLIAGREFLAAVTNRGFVIGLLMMPAIFAFMAMVLPRLMNAQSAPVNGQVVVVDPTGQVAGELRMTLAPDALATRRAENTRRALANMPAAAREIAAAGPSVERALGAAPNLEILERAAATALEDEKAWLLAPASGPRHLGVVVIHQDAVTLADGRVDYGTYDLYIPANLDERVESALHDGLREALVSVRIRARALDRSQVEAITTVVRAPSVTVTGDDERQTNVGFNRSLPFIFAGLLVFGVMIGGQTLLTSTVEEKSSRVIEVLLSAVSPFELMAGKILGQMVVSLLVLVLYLGLGLVTLMSFAMLGLVDPWLVLYLFLFFFITYLVFSSVFGAVGAAVNEMREAQSLMTPVMLVLMAPWFLAAPMAREPSSTLSVAMSFIPPVNTFAMMIRLASSAPPPAWQVWLTILIGLASAAVAVWFAAKIFKVGLLMHGKPPNLATLIRWARMA